MSHARGLAALTIGLVVSAGCLGSPSNLPPAGTRDAGPDPPPWDPFRLIPKIDATHCERSSARFVSTSDRVRSWLPQGFQPEPVPNAPPGVAWVGLWNYFCLKGQVRGGNATAFRLFGVEAPVVPPAGYRNESAQGHAALWLVASDKKFAEILDTWGIGGAGTFSQNELPETDVGGGTHTIGTISGIEYEFVVDGLHLSAALPKEKAAMRLFGVRNATHVGTVDLQEGPTVLRANGAAAFRLSGDAPGFLGRGGASAGRLSVGFDSTWVPAQLNVTTAAG